MSKRPSVDLNKAAQRSATSAAAEAALQQQQGREALVPLDKIGTRPTGDTREISPRHVKALAESISVLGLISPLTVDRHYRLLAGAHRKAAIDKLARENPNRFTELFPEGIPVNILDLDASSQRVEALQVEVEENTQRRRYTTQEIKAAAEKLRAAGYEQLKGRPGGGQKSLNRELMAVFRLSRRRITEILNESAPAPAAPVPVEKSAQWCALFSRIEAYIQETETFHQYLRQQLAETSVNEELSDTIQALEGSLQEIIHLIQKYS